jgi:hypothetical protein
MTEIAKRPPSGNTLSVFPNPARGDVWFQLEQEWTSPAQLYLFNALGQLIEQKTFQKDLHLPSGKLSPGCYYYQVDINGHLEKGKIVILE